MIIALLPVLQVLMYGYAITFDIREIRIGILDRDRSPASREMLRNLTSSHYFTVVEEWSGRSEIDEALLASRVQAALVIPSDFEKSLRTENEIPVQFIVDGANSKTAVVIMNYARIFFMSYSLGLDVRPFGSPVEVHPRVWYNPDLKSVHFIVPGLVAVFMMMICVLLTSTTIARERETGTMEQILVSPVGRAEMISGKFLPYVALAVLDAILVVVFSLVVFRVPFRGNPLLMLLLTVVYVYSALSIGLLISSRVKSQQVAMVAAQVLTTLPSVLLSGFIFPVASLPLFLKVVSVLVPARYFLTIIRGIMLKGVGFGVVYRPALFLFIFGTVLILLSLGRFRTDLE